MDEMILSGRRMLDGIVVNKETLAFDALKEVADKMDGSRRNGHFLNHKHTLKWFIKEQVPRRDNLIDKYRREKWLEEGSKSFVQRAHEKIEEVLENYRPEPISKDIELKIQEIYKKYNISEI